MYNANLPKDNELPSTKQLLVSTVGALVVALVLLIVAVLPAEYGVDPTGLGRAMGLTQMGEIKTQLAEEAAAEEAALAAKAVEVEMEIEAEVVAGPGAEAEVEVVESPEAAADPGIAEIIVVEEQMSVTLAPGEAAEIKLAMDEGQKATYSWEVDKGHLNFDVHGDNASISYHNYSKAKAVTGDEGELVAAFDGGHGWFWRNRSEEVVTVTLTVSGEFAEIKRVL